MKYFYAYEVKYQDVDNQRLLRLNKLEEYLLDVAGTVADELGFGISQLRPENLTWVLTSLSVEMKMLPTHTDRIVIETWIEANAHSLSIRDFRIYLAPGVDLAPDRRPKAADASWQLIGRGKSVWAVLEYTRREIVNIFSRPLFADNVDGEVLPISRAARPMPLSEPTGKLDYKIRYSDLDYNGHCNSCQYLEMMLDTARLNLCCRAVRLDISYVKEVMEGAEVVIAFLNEENSIRYQMCDEEGKSNSFARVSYIEPEF